MKFFMEVYGCTMNQGEARMMTERMRERGWTSADSVDEADLLLVVTCTVIGTTERKILKRLSNLVKYDKPMIVAGCMAEIQNEKIKEVAPQSELFGVHDILTNLDRLITKYSGSEPCAESIKRDEKSKVIGIVPIAQGCTNHCAYCIAKLARGDLRSYPKEKIIDNVRTELGKGAKEIRLTAMDTGCYGLDSGGNLAELINEVCKIDGDFRIRVGMANPENIQPIMDELINAYKNEKVYKFLHVPVQSGNDYVLKRMNRKYSVKDFLQIMDAFKNEFEDLIISTDIIVGFPGETESQFLDSLDLVDEVRPDIVNITRFSPRPGTPAQRMKDQIVGWQVKDRSRKLNNFRTEISRRNNERLVGREEKVLTIEYGKNNATVGRTSAYRPVVIFEDLPLGEFYNTKIVNHGVTYLVGEKVD